MNIYSLLKVYDVTLCMMKVWVTPVARPPGAANITILHGILSGMSSQTPAQTVIPIPLVPATLCDMCTNF